VGHRTVLDMVVKRKIPSPRRESSPLFRKYYYDDQITEDTMGGTCSTCGGDEICIYNFCRKTEKEETTEDLGVDGRIVLK
jgi:hypothetical protein